MPGPIKRNRLELISLEDQLRFKKGNELRVKQLIAKPMQKERIELQNNIIKRFVEKTGKSPGSLSEAMHGLGYKLPQVKKVWENIAEIEHRGQKGPQAEEIKKNMISSGLWHYMQFRVNQNRG